MPDDDVQRRWAAACDRLHMFQPDTAVPMFRVEPTLAAGIRTLRGGDRAAFRDAAHTALDRLVRNWTERDRAWHAGISKITPFAVDVAGAPLRLRLNDARGVIVDVLGQGGTLCDDDIVLDSVLPASVLPSLVGRRADDVMAVPRGLFDGSRRIVSSHVRFKRSTVVRLERATQVGVTYADLFGSPRRRFPPLEMPKAPGRRRPIR